MSKIKRLLREVRKDKAERREKEKIEIITNYIDLIQMHDDEEKRESEIDNLKYYYNGYKYYKEYFKIDYKLLLEIDTTQDNIFKKAIQIAKKILLTNLDYLEKRTNTEEGVFYSLFHSIEYSIKHYNFETKYKEIIKLYFNIFIDLDKISTQIESLESRVGTYEGITEAYNNDDIEKLKKCFERSNFYENLWQNIEYNILRF